MPAKEIPGERSLGQQLTLKGYDHKGPGPAPYEKAAAILRSSFRQPERHDLPGNVIEANVYDIVAELTRAGFVYQPIPGEDGEYVRMTAEQEDARGYLARALSNCGFYRLPRRAVRADGEEGAVDFYFHEVSGDHTYRVAVAKYGTVTGIDRHEGLAAINDPSGWEDARSHRAWDRIVAAEIPVSQAL